MRWFRLTIRAFITVLAVAVVTPIIAEAQITTGAVRGRVTSTTGDVVDGAEVIAINAATGVRRTTVANNQGEYAFPSLPVGSYRIQARRLGFGPVETPITVRLGETGLLNFQLTAAAVQISEVTVTAEATPLIDPDQSGVVDLVSSEQVDAIPVQGRNFADLVALSPKVGVDIGDGTGGNLSLGGGRRGANLIQIDGAGTTGTFFGGEARGSDRIPFAFSIESVKEFQIVVNGFDVEYGFFSGGVINAVTKTGTNNFHGSGFGYFRDDQLTRADFFGREANFSTRQIGGTLSGPIIRDKLHFFVAVERQDRNEPVFGLPSPTDTPDLESQRAHPDSVRRFLEILSTVYGVEDRTGEFAQTQDEWTIFGRLDWQISNSHRLTLRHNYTDLEQLGDRVSSDETGLNGGVFNNTGNSTILSLNSVFSPNVWNEARAQIAFEPRPREANTLSPELEVFVDSDFDGDGIRDASVGLECCNDPVLPNSLDETTFEFINNLNIRAGDHAVKLGMHFNYFDYVNAFAFGQQGQYDFDGLSDFENGIVDDFQRTLPNPGPDGQFFTGDDIIPEVVYKTYELSFYAQDSWHVSDNFTLTGGVRVDITKMPDAAPLNDDALTELGLRTDTKPEETNISPRVSFTFDPSGDGQTVIRGGLGLFYGRFPSVLYSNSLLNSGANSSFLICPSGGGDVPVIDVVRNFDPNRPGASVPTACEGFGFLGSPNINVFHPNFKYPQTVKASLGVSRALSGNMKVEFDFLYSDTKNNFYVEDQNLLDPQFTAAIEGRPVLAPADEFSASSGRIGFADNRVTSSIADGLVHVSSAEARTWQFSLGLEQRGSTFSWQAGYTFTDSKDNASYSCCISSTAKFETPTAGRINSLGKRGDEVNGTWGPSDFSRPHRFVVSGIVNLPLDISISGIWQTYSGQPWTPVIDGDANADGNSANDRAYIGSNLQFDDPGTDIPLLVELLENNECLLDQIGRIASRNVCRNPFYTQLDLRLRKRFRIVGTQALEVIFDVFNVLNMINSDWSRNVGVPQFGDERALLEIEGFDPATNAFIYSVNPSFGEEQDLRAFRTDQGTVQLGVKYTF
jgi:outer membrane receptor for ferrienterochelin and colicin